MLAFLCIFEKNHLMGIIIIYTKHNASRSQLPAPPAVSLNEAKLLHPYNLKLRPMDAITTMDSVKILYISNTAFHHKNAHLPK